MRHTLTHQPEVRLVTTEREQSEARELIENLGDTSTASLLAASAAGEPIRLPAALAELLGRVVEVMAEGGRITVGALPETLTTTTAAEQLGISRTTLMKWIRDGQIPAHKVGTHTRLRTDDVIEFRRARLRRQREAFDALRAFEEELDDA